jgi:hypothetical protein
MVTSALTITTFRTPMPDKAWMAVTFPRSCRRSHVWHDGPYPSPTQYTPPASVSGSTKRRASKLVVQEGELELVVGTAKLSSFRRLRMTQ